MTLETGVFSRLVVATGLTCCLTADSPLLSSDEILSRLENEANRRRLLLTGYSGSRQYTIQNQRFGKQAAVKVLMKYRLPEGERYTVLARSGSDKLNGIIDKILSSQASASVDNEGHQITGANYRVRLLGADTAAGRDCYVLGLTPRSRNQYLIVGKVWVEMASYAVVRIEGQFAASISPLVGAPRITQDFTEVNGFWLPRYVRSVTSSFLLGPTELEILYSNYQVDAGVLSQQ
jgi:hypothetical protein